MSEEHMASRELSQPDSGALEGGAADEWTKSTSGIIDRTANAWSDALPGDYVAICTNLELDGWQLFPTHTVDVVGRVQSVVMENGEPEPTFVVRAAYPAMLVRCAQFPDRAAVQPYLWKPFSGLASLRAALLPLKVDVLAKAQP